MKPEDKYIIEAAIAYVKAHRRWEIAAACESTNHEQYHAKMRKCSGDLIAAVDEKFKPENEEKGDLIAVLKDIRDEADHLMGIETRHLREVVGKSAPNIVRWARGAIRALEEEG